MNKPALDPRTAEVNFSFAPDGLGSVHREYFWYDPERPDIAAVRDEDFRRRNRSIGEEEWDRLRADAFDRGERRFLLKVRAEDPEVFDTDLGRHLAFLGYAFGPCRPSPETLAVLGLKCPQLVTASD